MQTESPVYSNNGDHSEIRRRFMREVVQDLLVPEMKAVKTSVDALRSEMILRDEKLEQSVRLGLENATQAIRHLSERLDSSIEIRERLASIEARLPRQ